MPTLGSVSGTYGYGRSPQTAPQPGFTIYPRIGGTKSTWTFSSNGTFIADGNILASTNTGDAPPVPQGNCFVITPATTFIANVKVWGAGGGQGGNLSSLVVTNNGGAGGVVYGQVLLQAGQEYTIFAGAPGWSNSDRAVNTRAGMGGAASGILLGNAFTTSPDTLIPVAIAGGGGGGARVDNYLTGAGGGNLYAQLGDRSSKYFGSYTYTTYSTDTIGRLWPGPGALGLLGQALPGTLAYSGSQTGLGSSVGSGGGGYRGGPVESGGQGFLATEQPSLLSNAGFFVQPPLYDSSARGIAGDPTKFGRVMIYTDNEYTVSNIVATGGTVEDRPIPGYELSYRYHTFTTSGKFTITSASPGDTIDIFAVGGGGGSAGTAGAGGGAVVIKTGFPAVTTANYIVNVGRGGSASDTLSANGVARIYGGYRGGDSAFFNNQLASKFFPDSYVRLIYSYGAPIRYINPSGDDTDGLTIATGYTTIESALLKNNSNSSLMVFVVLPGIYTPIIGSNEAQSPINDRGQPRIFVCAPNRVTINFAPSRTADPAPMAILDNVYSALYGAIIVRDMYATTDLKNLAFFSTSAGGYYIRGSFYNCVFKENSGQWAFVYGADFREAARFRIENCTFVTRDANQNLTSIANSSEAKVLVRNCAFSKVVTTNAVLINSANNQVIGAKYVITGVTDKGVYAGDYGWAAAITTPERTAKVAMLVAPGGGGAPLGKINSGDSIETMGGTSPGNNYGGDNLAYILPTHQANIDYSYFGFPGGAAASSMSAGGGGAGYSGFDATPYTSGAAVENTIGGIGVEWPYAGNVYYGHGGSATGAIDIASMYPGTIGQGGGGSAPAAGQDGIVQIRYVVPGTYTPLPVLRIKPMMAYGGITRRTSTYVEHRYTTSGLFKVLIPAEGYTPWIDILLVGGGGGGSGSGHYQRSEGGRGGTVVYRRYTVPSQNVTLTVTVGSGGERGYYHESVNGGSGTASRIGGTGNSGYESVTAPGGAGGVIDGGGRPAVGTLITSGLFSDNTEYYGPSGGGNRGQGGPTYNYGTYGSGGNGDLYGGWDDYGSYGFNGIVIIRYPTNPTS